MNHDDRPADTSPVVSHPLDELVRRTRLIAPDQDALRSDDAWFDALAERVTAAPVPEQVASPVTARGTRGARWRRHTPRFIVLGAIAVGAVGLGAGAAVSVTEFLQPDGLQFTCVLGSSADSEEVSKRATVADPVDACREEWPDGAQVPELAVFMNELAVYVAPVSWDGTRDELNRVAQDVAFDPRPARLEAALDDWIDGIQSDCFSREEAVDRITADFARLSLLGWSVRLDDNGGREVPADGVETCAWGLIAEGDASTREVIVRGEEPGGGAAAGYATRSGDMTEEELRAYYSEGYQSAVEDGQEFSQPGSAWVEESITIAISVREQLEGLRAAFPEGRCLTAGEAEQEVAGVLDPEWDSVVDVSIDDTLSCAVVEVGMGGTWLVSIVGPATVPETGAARAVGDA